MIDDAHHHPAQHGESPTLSDDQRHALFVAQLQVLPDDWSRVKGSWRDFGRVLRSELAALPIAA